MRLEELYSLNKMLSERGVLLCFNGPFSHGLIEEFGRALRQHLQDAKAADSVLTDVFSVYVEQAQNIQRYARKVAQEDGEAAAAQLSGMVAVTRDGESFTVCSGNRLRPQDVEPMRARLDALRGKDKAELKALYKKQLKAPSSAEGAGLGLLSMARTARAPVEFELASLPEGGSFLYLRVPV